MEKRLLGPLLALLAASNCSNRVEPRGTTTRDLSDPPSDLAIPPKPSVDLEKTARKAKEALRYVTVHDFDRQRCILVDMSLHSGVKRLFVWNFQSGQIEHAFLVGHGCCNHPWSGTATRGQPGFSNAIGGHCTALGKYRIGERKHSDWGIHVKYEMHGLDATNSNALSRFIVFHSWEAVSDQEIYPEGTPEGWGCPTISNESMKVVDALLRTADKPLLMWIYVD